ncbi:MAG: SiaB family protein kinase [Thermonemataceae bacterium]|nr:SiaB family protein kinase [Thermonemataceae bacterium]
MLLQKDYSQLYEAMQDENFILSYKGQVGFVQVSSLLRIIEDRLETAESNPKVRKKVYNIATECFQNLSHHIENHIEKIGSKALAVFEAYEDKYIIATGNYVLKNVEIKIKEKIDHINSLNKDELRELHRQVLADDSFSEKGTAGLGFIDIARKTDGNLFYDFHGVNEDITFFTLKVEITRTMNLPK